MAFSSPAASRPPGAKSLQPPTQGMTSEIGVFRDGFLWILNQQGDGQYNPGVDHVFAFGGVPGDRPIVGNWNGSTCSSNQFGYGCTNVGIYRSASQYFLLDTNGDAFVDAGDQYFKLSIAQADDLPVAGDWNGDGRTKVGLFRPSTCEWFLDFDGNGVWNASIDKHFTPTDCQPGDMPVVGAWTGGRIKSATEDPTGIDLTSYNYDALDNLHTVTQGTLPTRTFTYNSLSQLV